MPGMLKNRRQRDTCQSLDISEELTFGGITEGDRTPSPSGPTCSTNPVDIALGFVGQIVIEHVTHAIDIDTT